MSIKTSKFNPFEGIETNAEISEFLSYMYASEHDFFIDTLGDLVEHYGIKEVSKKSGICQAELKRLINGESREFTTVQKLLQAFEININTAAHA